MIIMIRLLGGLNELVFVKRLDYCAVPGIEDELVCLTRSSPSTGFQPTGDLPHVHSSQGQEPIVSVNDLFLLPCSPSSSSSSFDIKWVQLPP